ncbi:MAG: DUF4258 domain-containing protein [Terriglobia bacterium]
MPRSKIDRIRQRIRLRQYDMSAHAMEEMAEDALDVIDVETAVCNGRIIRTEEHDPRGAKHVVEGIGSDQCRSVGVVGRFTDTGRYLIITVYEITHDQTK